MLFIGLICVLYVYVRYRYHGRLIRDPKLIAKRYLKGWFLIDFPTRCVVLLLLINLLGSCLLAIIIIIILIMIIMVIIIIIIIIIITIIIIIMH